MEKKDLLHELFNQSVLTITEMKKTKGGVTFVFCSKSGPIFCEVLDSGTTYYDLIGNVIKAGDTDAQACE
jgi:hypothetical protein